MRRSYRNRRPGRLPAPRGSARPSQRPHRVEVESLGKVLGKPATADEPIPMSGGLDHPVGGGNDAQVMPGAPLTGSIHIRLEVRPEQAPGITCASFPPPTGW